MRRSLLNDTFDKGNRLKKRRRLRHTHRSESVPHSSAWSPQRRCEVEIYFPHYERSNLPHDFAYIVMAPNETVSQRRKSRVALILPQQSSLQHWLQILPGQQAQPDACNCQLYDCVDAIAADYAVDRDSRGSDPFFKNLCLARRRCKHKNRVFVKNFRDPTQVPQCVWTKSAVISTDGLLQSQSCRAWLPSRRLGVA